MLTRIHTDATESHGSSEATVKQRKSEKTLEVNDKVGIHAEFGLCSRFSLLRLPDPCDSVASV
jgi:hypothetical protein